MKSGGWVCARMLYLDLVSSFWTGKMKQKKVASSRAIDRIIRSTFIHQIKMYKHDRINERLFRSVAAATFSFSGTN